ncbi:MAG: TonB-dependent receptor, partial [Gemmatimonadetes bacterium]|nr:TonB-dependent receptor [Gemmatimonadota bacterium]
HWDLRRESRHFLDRANLRPIAARTIHGAGIRRQFGKGMSVAAEISNLTDNGVADLWGYPLPGRSVSISLSVEHPSSHLSNMSRGNQ